SVTFNGMVEQVVVLPNGKILVGGFFTSCNGVPRKNIVRLNSDGSVDGSFVYSHSGSVYPFVVQADDKIVTRGGFRLNTDGSVDNTFVLDSYLDGSYDYILTAQPDGKIIVWKAER